MRELISGAEREARREELLDSAPLLVYILLAAHGVSVGRRGGARARGSVRRTVRVSCEFSLHCTSRYLWYCIACNCAIAQNSSIAFYSAPHSSHTSSKIERYRNENKQNKHESREAVTLFIRCSVLRRTANEGAHAEDVPKEQRGGDRTAEAREEDGHAEQRCCNVPWLPPRRARHPALDVCINDTEDVRGEERVKW